MIAVSEAVMLAAQESPRDAHTNGFLAEMLPVPEVLLSKTGARRWSNGIERAVEARQVAHATRKSDQYMTGKTRVYRKRSKATSLWYSPGWWRKVRSRRLRAFLYIAGSKRLFYVLSLCLI
jgi:hypothetical protein